MHYIEIKTFLHTGYLPEKQTKLDDLQEKFSADSLHDSSKWKLTTVIMYDQFTNAHHQMEPSSEQLNSMTPLV